MKVECLRSGDEREILLIHGFMGGPGDWLSLVRALPAGPTIRAVTLPGHLPDSQPEDVLDFEATTTELLGQIKAKQVSLIGYSLGGRLALACAAKSANVRNLILISSTAGLEDDAERAARRQQDDETAGTMTAIQATGDWKRFLLRWWSQPIFSSLNSQPGLLEDLVSSRSRLNAAALAACLSRWSPGRIEPCWSHLPGLIVCCLFLAGAKDEKFTRLADRLHQLTPGSTQRTIGHAGHILHMEAPSGAAVEIADFLQK